MTKTELRKSLLKARQAMPVDNWQQKSQQICHHLQASSLFAQAQTILAYFSFRQEPDLSALFSCSEFNHSKTRSKIWGFPRCVDRDLHWHEWPPQHSWPLQIGAYGIPEPHPALPPIQPETVDLLLIPAVACDRKGYRLGYGGGYYDRLLSSPPWNTKPTIGITFDFAHLPQLPIDTWDRPLQAVCTEMGLQIGEGEGVRG
jgi:5-formyltetrahydrofolate cyclo-ligase